MATRPCTNLDPFIFCRWHHPEVQSRLGKNIAFYGLELPEDAAHSADADSEVTALLVSAMVWAGYIPDDVETAFEQQANFKTQMEADVERWGRKLYVDRVDSEKLYIASGVYRGRCVDDLDESYIKRITTEWSADDMSEEARAYILERTRTQGVLFLRTKQRRALFTCVLIYFSVPHPFALANIPAAYLACEGLKIEHLARYQVLSMVSASEHPLQ